MRLFLEVDRPNAAAGYRVSICVHGETGLGTGYRITGAKYGGAEPADAWEVELTRRDADEIRRYLDGVFPREGDR